MAELPNLIKADPKMKSRQYELYSGPRPLQNLNSKEIIIQRDRRVTRGDSLFHPESTFGIIESFIKGKNPLRETLLEHAATYNKPLAAQMIDMGFEANFGWKDYFKSILGIKPDKFRLAQKLGINDEYNTYVTNKAKESIVDIEAPAAKQASAEVDINHQFTTISGLQSITSTYTRFIGQSPKPKNKNTKVDIEIPKINSNTR